MTKPQNIIGFLGSESLHREGKSWFISVDINRLVFELIKTKSIVYVIKIR